MPLVSIIVPNYNHERFLDRRLESIFTQSFEDYEVILLDDNSTDDSVSVFKKFKKIFPNKIVVCEINTSNSGSPFIQWQKGLSLAKGKYIWIAESDDYADPSFLKRTVLFLNENEDIGLVSTTANLIDEEGVIFESTSKWLSTKMSFNSENIYIGEGLKFISNYMLSDNVIYNASGVLFRKKIATELSLPYQEYKQIGDVVFWVSLALKSNVGIIAENLNYWRKHSGSVTAMNYGKPSLVVKEHLRMVENIYKENNQFRKIYSEIKFKIVKNIIRKWWVLKRRSKQKIDLGDASFFIKIMKHYLFSI
jgi:glycosyltransferase involved in cell wall biosynthesis